MCSKVGVAERWPWSRPVIPRRTPDETTPEDCWHLHVLSVGTPSRPALERVYAAYTRRATKVISTNFPEPDTKEVVSNLPAAMIDAYEFNQRTFSTKGPQCVYSARELTRWCRALEQASDNCSNASALVRLWLHEGLRLFADRLPEMTDVQICDDA